MKFDIWGFFFPKSVEKIESVLKSDNNNCSLHNNPSTFMIVSYLSKFFLEWDVSDKSCRKNQDTFYAQYPPPRKSCPLWDNAEKYCTGRQATHDNIIRRMGISCLINKATDAHPEYVIPIAFPLQQWLRERASILRFAYTACIVLNAVLHDFYKRRFGDNKDSTIIYQV